MKKHSALLFLLFCIAFQSFAQNDRRILGTITDTSKTAIPNVNVLIIVKTDTLRAITNQSGNFSIPNINAERFSLQVSMVGYLKVNEDYEFPVNKKSLQLDTILLKMSSQMLKEVVIKAKPNPVRFMMDTVEYNADAFQVLEGDNVADLIKQFPGLEVDADYNVQTGGKNITKLRVNGVDFFTGNVQDFIAKLPAGIVSKIQIIDDFGDEANFTGIKSGESQKIMNIATKPGMDKGKFGNLSGEAGTNEMIGSGARIDLWRSNKQSSANVNLNKSNNGAGDNRSISMGLSHKDKMGKHGSGGFAYNMRNSSSAFLREQLTESLNFDGNLINNSLSEGTNDGQNHSLSWNADYTNKTIRLNAGIMGSYNVSGNENNSLNTLSGFLRQDLKNSNSSKNSSPNISANVSISRKLKNAKNSFSVRSSYVMSSSGNDQNILTNTLYFDNKTGVLVKDSLLNREVNSSSSNQNFSLGFDYSIGLKKLKDSLGRQSLNFSYNGSTNRSTNETSTFVFDNLSNKVSYVDSLSTSFSSISLNQTLNVNYNYHAGKMRYNVGFSARPNMQSNSDVKLMNTLANNTFNYSPAINFSRTLKKGKTLSLNYQASNNNPSIHQLQPIRNYLSLQNIAVGNPNLKPSFRHNFNSDFNYSHLKSGRSLQVGLSAIATQREIVNHLIMVPDTLNSFKQISKYENVNGNYNVNGRFQVLIPIKAKNVSFNYSGTAGFSNQAVIFNNQKRFGKGFNFSQQIGGRLTLKKITLNSNVNYSKNNNNNINSFNSMISFQPLGIGQITAPTFYRTTTLGVMMDMNLRLKKLQLSSGIRYNNIHNEAIGNLSARNISDLSINLSSGLTVKKSYRVNFSVAKRSNFGYSQSNINPLIINASLEKSFLKARSLNLSIRGNDLLGQGNNISRMVAGNTTIDSRSRLQTQIVSLRLNYNISNFGGRRFAVDAD